MVKPAERQEGRLGVVVLGYMAPDQLDVCVGTLAESLARARTSADIVLVNNDGRTYADLSTAALRQLPLSGNVGYGAAMNEGARALATCDLLMFVTQDCVFSADTISSFWREKTACGAAFVIGPTLKSLRRSDGSERTIRGGSLSRHAWRLGDAQKGSDVAWLDGACLFTTRELFERLGGFATDYWMYYEDVDFCIRARRSGAALIVADTLVAEASGEGAPYLRFRNRMLLVRKLAPKRVLVVNVLGAGMHWLATVLRDPKTARAAGRGMIDGLLRKPVRSRLAGGSA